MSEGQVLSACIQWLCYHGCDIIRNNTGTFKKGYDRKDGSHVDYYIRVGKKHSGDIVAISPTGRWIEVETKFAKGKLDEGQLARQAEIRRRGGVAVAAWSVDDLERAKRDILAKAVYIPCDT